MAELLTLILIVAVLATVITTIIWQNLHLILDNTHVKLTSLRNFIVQHENAVDIGFQTVFFLEQGALVVSSYFVLGSNSLAQFVVGVFALLVVTTASIQKLLSDIQKKYQTYVISSAIRDYEMLLNKHKKAQNKLKDLFAESQRK